MMGCSSRPLETHFSRVLFRFRPRSVPHPFTLSRAWPGLFQRPARDDVLLDDMMPEACSKKQRPPEGGLSPAARGVGRLNRKRPGYRHQGFLMQVIRLLVDFTGAVLLRPQIINTRI